jgi:hypothetical protein
MAYHYIGKHRLYFYALAFGLVSAYEFYLEWIMYGIQEHELTLLKASFEDEK